MTKKYLDTCCLIRPFDDQTQEAGDLQEEIELWRVVVRRAVCFWRFP